MSLTFLNCDANVHGKNKMTAEQTVNECGKLTQNELCLTIMFKYKHKVYAQTNGNSYTHSQIYEDIQKHTATHGNNHVVFVVVVIVVTIAFA